MNSQGYRRTWSCAHPMITIQLVLLFPAFPHRKLIPVKDPGISSQGPWWFSTSEVIRKEIIDRSFLCLRRHSNIFCHENHTGVGDSAFSGV